MTESVIVSPDIVSCSMHPKYFTLKCGLICICPYFIFSFLTFYFEFSSKKYRLSFVITKINTQLIIDKPVTNAFKIFIQLFFNFINIIMLTEKACIISIKKKIIFDSLSHIINIYEKEQWARNRSFRYTTGHTCRLRKYIPQIN